MLALNIVAAAAAPYIKLGALAQLGERQTEASIRAALLQVSGSIPESAISFCPFLGQLVWMPSGNPFLLRNYQLMPCCCSVCRRQLLLPLPAMEAFSQAVAICCRFLMLNLSSCLEVSWTT